MAVESFPDMQTLHEATSKLVGAECRLFPGHVEVEMPASPGTAASPSERMSYEDIEQVRLRGWTGLSLADLVIRGRGRELEVRMVPVGEAEEVKQLIRRLAREAKEQRRKAAA